MSSRHRGQSLVHAMVSKAEKAQQHTAPNGQDLMEAEVKGMTLNYNELVQKMNSTKDKLQVRTQNE